MAILGGHSANLLSTLVRHVKDGRSLDFNGLQDNKGLADAATAPTPAITRSMMENVSPWFAARAPDE